MQNPEEAAQAVAATRYPPQGVRGVSAVNHNNAYGGVTDYFKFANDVTGVIVQIETGKAAAQLEAIAAVPGVDALMMGPMDLSLELGIPGELRHPRILAAYDASLKAAVAGGKHFVCGDAGGPPVAQLVAQGARILLGSNDANYLLQALTQAAQTLDREAQVSGS